MPPLFIDHCSDNVPDVRGQLAFEAIERNFDTGNIGSTAVS